MAPPPPSSPSPSSYDSRFIKGNDDDKGVHTNQQILPSLSYHTSSNRGSNEDRDMDTNQQLLSPSLLYLPLSINDNKIGMQANR